MSDYDETGSAIGVAGTYHQTEKSLQGRTPLRVRLTQKRDHMERQIIEIDKVISLLDANPQTEELLDLLPKIGLY